MDWTVCAGAATEWGRGEESNVFTLNLKKESSPCVARGAEEVLEEGFKNKIGKVGISVMSGAWLLPCPK